MIHPICNDNFQKEEVSQKMEVQFVHKYKNLRQQKTQYPTKRLIQRRQHQNLLGDGFKVNLRKITPINRGQSTSIIFFNYNRDGDD